MTKKRWLLAIGAVVAAAGLAAGLSLALTGGGSGSRPLSNDDYERIWDATHVGDPQQAVLARWPKVPYQHYTDNLKDDCFEWRDHPEPPYTTMPAHLFDLCFKDGRLRSKELM